MAKSRLIESAFNIGVKGHLDDAVKALRKNKRFKKLDKNVKAIVKRDTPKITVDKIVDSIPNKSDEFSKKFGKKFTKNDNGDYDDLAKRMSDGKKQRRDNGLIGTKSKEAPKIKQDKVGKGDNWVYKTAAAGVGGGLILSMANNKGQQSNSQLYNQGGQQGGQQGGYR